jgi:rhodanese-like protein
MPPSCWSWKDVGWQKVSADRLTRRGRGPRLGIIMPAQIGRDELAALTGQGAQLVEVLPAGDYDWAHLPGAVNLPLKELDARAGELDRSRPVIVYCQDWY